MDNNGAVKVTVPVLKANPKPQDWVRLKTLLNASFTLKHAAEFLAPTKSTLLPGEEANAVGDVQESAVARHQ